MDSHVFDIVIITLVVVVILHLMFNNSLFVRSCDTCKNEDMCNIQDGIIDHAFDDGRDRDVGAVGLDRTLDSKNWYHVANKLADNNEIYDETAVAIESLKKHTANNNCRKSDNNCKLVFPDFYERKMTSDPFEADSIPDADYPESLSNRRFTENEFTNVFGNVCATNEDSKEMKRYIRDYVLDGKTQCGCVVDKSKSSFTRDEIDSYREKQIVFRDKIYGTSSPAEDPVDRMNEITLQGGISAEGQTIADFYDDLVTIKNSPAFQQPIPNVKCIKAPTIDAQSGIPQGFYTGDANGGRYMMRDNWMYSGENPNNGGLMYDGIYGFDQMIDPDRMMI